MFFIFHFRILDMKSKIINYISVHILNLKFLIQNQSLCSFNFIINILLIHSFDHTSWKSTGSLLNDWSGRFYKPIWFKSSTPPYLLLFIRSVLPYFISWSKLLDYILCTIRSVFSILWSESKLGSWRWSSLANLPFGYLGGLDLFIKLLAEVSLNIISSSKSPWIRSEVTWSVSISS